MFYANLYTKYRAGLMAYVVSRTADESIAEDIVQQVFLKVMEKRCDPETIQNWKGYLFILVRNELFNLLRQRRVQLHLLSDYANKQIHSTSHDPLAEKEYRQRLKAAIERLPAQQRLVYELRAVYNWNNKEVAAVLNLSPSTAKGHYQEARKKLYAMVA